MKQRIFVVLMGIFLSLPALADLKTLPNEVLREKGYVRLEGKNQFKLGCRYLVRSEDRTVVNSPTTVSGMSIGFTVNDIFYAVPSNDKATLWGSDGTVQAVTTWRTCLVL